MVVQDFLWQGYLALYVSSFPFIFITPASDNVILCLLSSILLDARYI